MLKFDFDGQGEKELTIPECAKLIGVTPKTIYKRLRDGLPIEEVLKSK